DTQDITVAGGKSLTALPTGVLVSSAHLNLNGTINAGSSEVVLSPGSSAGNVAVGDTSGDYNVTLLMLNAIKAGTLHIGSLQQSGNFNVTTSLNVTTTGGNIPAYNLEFETGGNFSAASKEFTLGTKTIHITAQGSVD